ncbi:MAG: indole-3-glycerol phosphate synthase TrpC [Ferruginibacter sp.]
MNILDTITVHKKEELVRLKKQSSVNALRSTALFERNCVSMTRRLLQPAATGIIAEFKRKSPSKGIINASVTVEDVTAAYTTAGASGLSVLTDEHFFGGSNADLLKARVNDNAILRKDFIVDAWQLTESKSIGADVILLIAACLSPSQVREYAAEAKELGMEVLLELHEEAELEHVCDTVDMVGINNRSLKTFEVDVNRSVALSKMLPAGKIKVAESGIDDPSMIRLFRNEGYKGFLMGEHFMKQQDPGAAFQHFVTAIPH